MKLLVLVLAPALGAALVGWRTTHRRRHSLYDEKPVGMSDADYSRRERRRYLVRRISATTLYGVAGAVIGFGLSFYFRMHG